MLFIRSFVYCIVVLKVKIFVCFKTKEIVKQNLVTLMAFFLLNARENIYF